MRSDNKHRVISSVFLRVYHVSVLPRGFLQNRCTMLTRLNAVSTFSLMGFMLQYVEGMMVSFHYLFISALLKGKHLLLPSEKESNPPIVSCQCLTS